MQKCCFYNDVNRVPGSISTRDKSFQCKRFHSKQGDNITKSHESTLSEREGKIFIGYWKPNPIRK